MRKIIKTNILCTKQFWFVHCISITKPIHNIGRKKEYGLTFTLV